MTGPGHGSRYHPPVAGGSPLFREIITLTMQNVFYRILNALLIPQTTTATFVCPRTSVTFPAAIFPHLSSCIRFECIKSDSALLSASVDDRMHMICSYIESEQMPTAD